MKAQKWLIISIIMLSLTIIFSGLWIGNSIQSSEKTHLQFSNMQTKNQDILSFSEAAVFLNLSEERLNWLLINSKAKDGKGIPNFVIGDKAEFSKASLAKWIIYLSENNISY
jgi:hypothetical protein